MFDLLDFETSADGMAANAGAPAGEVPSQTAPAADAPAGAGGETEPSAVVTDTAPAWTPDQITALRSNPEFQAFMAEEAATIADARFQQLVAQHSGGNAAPQPGADQGGVNLNEFLDPYGESFGTNLASVLGGIVQRFEQSLDQRFQPINEQAAQTQAAEHDELLKGAITDTATALGGLRGGDAAVQRVMADVRNRYMPEAARVYGQTDRAAQVAIERAIRAERDYQNEITGGQTAANAEHLATIAGARTDLTAAGSGSGLVTLPDGPTDPRDRVARYARAIQAAS